MGGLSAAAGSAGAAGTAGTAGSAGLAGAAGTSALLASKAGASGLSATSMLGPMGMAFDVKNMFDSKKAAKKQARNSFLLQYANMQRKKNILEQQLATRHARMATWASVRRLRPMLPIIGLLTKLSTRLKTTIWLFWPNRMPRLTALISSTAKICLIRDLPLPEKF